MNSKRIAALAAVLVLCLTTVVPASAVTLYDVAKTAKINETVSFSASDFNKNGRILQSMTITSLTNTGTEGTLMLGSTPAASNTSISKEEAATLSFQPISGKTGAVTFTWDGIYSGSLVTGVTATMVFEAKTPVANNMTIYVAKNATYYDTLNASDPMGYPLIFSEASAPQKGDATISATKGTFTYRPDTGFVGQDSFKYQVYNGHYTAEATVTVYVSDVAAPTAQDSTVKVSVGGDVSDAMKGTDNVTTATPAGLTFRVTREPTKGTLSWKSDGTFTYTHTGDQLGYDSFDFVANNGYKDSNTATVTIDIELPLLDYQDMLNHWGRTSAGSLGGAKLVVGDRIMKMYYYRPNELMTRMEFVMFLNSIMEYTPSTNATSLFADVTVPHQIMPANTAKENGVTAGTVVNGRLYFYPEKSVTRIEAMRLLDNAMKFDKPNTTENLLYADRDSIPEWAVPSVRNLIGYKIVTNTTGNLRPTDNMTRAEAAELLYKAYIERKK